MYVSVLILLTKSASSLISTVNVCEPSSKYSARNVKFPEFSSKFGLLLLQVVSFTSSLVAIAIGLPLESFTVTLMISSPTVPIFKIGFSFLVKSSVLSPLFEWSDIVNVGSSKIVSFTSTLTVASAYVVLSSGSDNASVARTTTSKIWLLTRLPFTAVAPASVNVTAPVASIVK